MRHLLRIASLQISNRPWQCKLSKHQMFIKMASRAWVRVINGPINLEQSTIGHTRRKMSIEANYYERKEKLLRLQKQNNALMTQLLSQKRTSTPKRAIVYPRTSTPIKRKQPVKIERASLFTRVHQYVIGCTTSSSGTAVIPRAVLDLSTEL